MKRTKKLYILLGVLVVICIATFALSKTEEKKENIIKYIDNDLQVFITSTDINNIDTKLIEKADVFYVENAKVYERGEKDGRE